MYPAALPPVLRVLQQLKEISEKTLNASDNEYMQRNTCWYIYYKTEGVVISFSDFEFYSILDVFN